MRILELDADRARTVTDVGSERFTVTPMAQIARGVMTFLRFGPEGKVVERWNRMDEVGLTTQLG